MSFTKFVALTLFCMGSNKRFLTVPCRAPHCKRRARGNGQKNSVRHVAAAILIGKTAPGWRGRLDETDAKEYINPTTLEARGEAFRTKMRITVCIKQVPGTSQVEIDPVTGVLKRDGVESKMNPFDLYALETALRLKQ